MPQWSHCRVTIRFDDGSPPHEDDDSQLGIEAGQIVVVYMDDEGPVVLGGHEHEPGCFELLARSRPRHATLERSPDGRVLVGSWQEGIRAGKWRIELTGAADPDAGSDSPTNGRRR
jgi:hypothetical protein